MRLEEDELRKAAKETGFVPEVLEKTVLLFGLLESIRDHPDLQGRIALKGGTALNLFVFDVPRLSVDIDLNYIGSKSREGMLKERPVVEKALQEAFRKEGLSVRRMPEEHAGGKFSLRYPSALGGSGNLTVDINYIHRIPLWPVKAMDSRKLGDWGARGIPVFDPHELAASKLSALFSRGYARDLFDSRRILTDESFDPEKLRLGFVVYGAMGRKDLRMASPESLSIRIGDFTGQLSGLLGQESPRTQEEWEGYKERLLEECREGLSVILPFRSQEKAFLDAVMDKGEIRPSLLTEDTDLARRIREHPGLEWKALNVRRHKGLDPSRP